MDTSAPHSTLDNEELAADALLEEINPQTERKEMIIAYIKRLLVRGVKEEQDLLDNVRAAYPDLSGISIRSIYRYKAIIRERTKQAMAENGDLRSNVFELAKQMTDLHEELVRELWTVYHSTTKDSVKVSAAREIRQTQKEWREGMQSLGLVYQAPTKVDVNASIENKDKDELNKAFNEFFMSRHTTQQLPEAKTKESTE